MERQFHEVANIFPMMTGEEFATLKQDIADNGQREAIWLHPDGRIIDGRNRYRACMELGKAPVFRTWDGRGSLVSFVVSLNLHRRHLNATQRAVIANDMLPMLETEARERMRLSEGRGQKGSEKVPDLIPQNGKAASHAAALVGTNAHYVSDVKRIAQVAPPLMERMRTGEVTVTEAKRQVKAIERAAKQQDNAAKIATAPDPDQLEGVYSTIVIDPPWDWGDEGDIDQFGRARPTYHTMTIDQLHALPVGKLAAPDCHLYLWITNRSLPKGFALLESWGFRYVSCVTWVKPHFGMGNYFRGQTEHILFGVRGSLPILRRDVGTVFQAPRGPDGHSSKPEAAYELIEQCSPAPYLDMFSRRQRLGWMTWGENGLL